MKIETIELTKENMMDVVSDDSVYVIVHKSHWNEHRMNPIREISFEDILSEENVVIRITDQSEGGVLTGFSFSFRDIFILLYEKRIGQTSVGNKHALGDYYVVSRVNSTDATIQ